MPTLSKKDRMSHLVACIFTFRRASRGSRGAAMASLYGQSFLSLLNDIHGQCLTAYRVISVAVTCES